MDAVLYCKGAEQKINTPTLFDLDEPEEGESLEEFPGDVE